MDTKGWFFVVKFIGNVLALAMRTYVKIFVIPSWRSFMQDIIQMWPKGWKQGRYLHQDLNCLGFKLKMYALIGKCPR